MLNAAVVVTIAFVAAVSVGGTTVYTQVAQASDIVVEPKASADNVSFIKMNVLDSIRSWPIKGVRPATPLAIRSDRFLNARRSNRSETRGRSKKRIVAGAIAGGVGGFFAGGFLGAHIEGVTAMTPAFAGS